MGDPINAVKEVDELIVVDIDATVQNREPDYGMIKNLAAECRMPLCYGGGVRMRSAQPAVKAAFNCPLTGQLFVNHEDAKDAKVRQG